MKNVKGEKETDSERKKKLKRTCPSERIEEGSFA